LREIIMDKFSIKINGMPLLPTIYGDIIEIIVDTDVFMPGMFTILLDDTQVVADLPALKHTDNALLFRIGAKVEISAAVDAPVSPVPKRNTLIKGEITSIEPVFQEDGTIRLCVRGYDAAHRLTLGKKTRAWGTGLAPTVNESQIVTTIAGEYSLTPAIDMSGLAGVTYEYVMQYNQSDWEFLWARARLLGYQLFVDGTTLRFTQASLPRQALPVKLEWGNNLRIFKPRFVASGATTAVQARGWNADLKKEVKAPNLPGLGMIDPPSSPSVAKGITGSTAIRTGLRSKAKDYVVSPVVRTPLIASALAKARFLQHESHYVRASGEADGDPCLLAGCNAAVVNVGVRFAGTYFVTKARHIYRGGAYRVEFEISGRNPYTFGHLTGQDTEQNKIYGAVIALVTDINDPMFNGRLKVKYPWMPEGSMGVISSSWARMASLGGGKNGGIYFTPEVNDEVLVVFEQGDVNFPYIVGVLWSKKDRPPAAPKGKAVMAGKVNQRIIKSRSGHVIVLDDTPGQEKILIQDKSKNGIEIDSVKNEMTIKTSGNLILNVGGRFVVNSKMDFDIKSKTKGSISGATKLELASNTAASIKAGTSSLDLQVATAALKSTQVDVQANAKASVKGGAMVEIQGALVKIN
jgi:phage protein D